MELLVVFLTCNIHKWLKEKVKCKDTVFMYISFGHVKGVKKQIIVFV